ncbi:MAG: dockerin type I repeat-containing protein [Ruminococcus sp.]|uniref:dockerin type I repeat-containing protein n=1 Tax=Ruminococcus sp. TaxID=41978 RepID=UPI0028736BF4|nr:dockerin type I repeat-containing protein [Ruminococcus sp.]MBQ3286063.1 dockerin type I repeat-containing protein [Ruminococcus sp.]MBQ3330469.1 dockerin type I repeat-containing protein [Ruminococcus sp.]
MTFRLRIAASILFAAVVLMIAGTAAAAESNILGDADGDGEVTIIDATAVQVKLANQSVSGFFEQNADVDKNGRIESIDVTYIQRYLNELDPPYPIGVQPTAAPTQSSTDAEGWGNQIYRP